MELRLDHSSPLPLHVQAEALLRRLIQEPHYRDGALLPDEVALSKRLGISRNTLRAAITRMVQQGLLERRRGVGTRAVTPALATGLEAWPSFTREMRDKGITVQFFDGSYSVIPADEEVARGLQLDEGTPVWLLERVRGYEDEPAVVFRSWFHPRVDLDGSEPLLHEPLYEYLEREKSVVAERSREEIAAVAASRDMARKLIIRTGTPLLVRRRVVTDAGSRPIEFAINHYRSDRFVYSVQIQRNSP